MFEMENTNSPLSAYVEEFLEVLLRLYMGEETKLYSCWKEGKIAEAEGEYVCRESLWTPDLYMIVAPLYNDTITLNGAGSHYYPVIRRCLASGI